MPRRQSGLRYGSSNTIVEISPDASPDWRGTPNLVGKSVWIRAMGSMFMAGLLQVMVKLYHRNRKMQNPFYFFTQNA